MKNFVIILALAISLSFASAGVVKAQPTIDGVISSGEWTGYLLGISVTTWEGGMSVDVYAFADDTYLYVAYVADMSQTGWSTAEELCISGNFDFAATTEYWPAEGYTHISVYGDGFAQTDGSDWYWPDGWGNTDSSVFTNRAIEYYVGIPCYGSPYPNTAELKIPLTLLLYAGPADQIAISGQYWQYEWAEEFYVALAPTCMPITGYPCVDDACCVIDYVYEDELGLLNHGMYVSCVSDAARECGLSGAERGAVVSAAAKSGVNK